jgi:pimeloyl-ACP methyl ester carboxylesterase
MTTGRRQDIRVGRHRVAYAAAGEGDAVVLVHGLSGSGRWWDRNLDALAQRWRVYAVDLPGFGGSTGGPGFDVAEAPRVLLDWADRLGIRRATWVGHSMGGRIVAELAADAPDRVTKLILVDATVFPAGPDWPVTPIGFLAALPHAAPSLLPVVVRDALRAGPVALLRATRDVLATGCAHKLPRIAAPTLVVWGEHDTICAPNVGRKTSLMIPGARMTLVPDADHAPMWGKPRAFNVIVAAFLEDDDRRGGVAGGSAVAPMAAPAVGPR